MDNISLYNLSGHRLELAHWLVCWLVKQFNAFTLFSHRVNKNYFVKQNLTKNKSKTNFVWTRQE